MKTVLEIQREGWQALVDKLGMTDALRLLVLFVPGKGDYIKERQEIFKDKTFDELYDELRKFQKTSSSHNNRGA